MTDGIVDKIVIPSYTFMKQINDNLAPNIADMILDYYQQELKQLKQELKAEIEKELLPSKYDDMPTAWTIRRLLIGNGEKQE